jgi:curved DNA-binding protein CbpA
MSGNHTADFYAVLGVPPDASNMDIINAYRQAKLTYKADSIATYSLFDDAELDGIRSQIEQAYQTLSNPEKRRVYDAGLAGDTSNRWESVLAPVSDHSNVVNLAEKAQVPAGIRYRMATATVFPGALLREIREFKGVELATIAEHTKISRRYLQAIEEEDTGRLPEPAYLKGYLKQYAAEIGLNPELVAGHYPPLQNQASKNG